jgi:hypothetical protein
VTNATYAVLWPHACWVQLVVCFKIELSYEDPCLTPGKSSSHYWLAWGSGPAIFPASHARDSRDAPAQRFLQLTLSCILLQTRPRLSACWCYTGQIWEMFRVRDIHVLVPLARVQLSVLPRYLWPNMHILRLLVRVPNMNFWLITVYSRFNGLIGARGCPILRSVRTAHKHLRRTLPILIFKPIITFVLHSGLFFFVHGILI